MDKRIIVIFLFLLIVILYVGTKGQDPIPDDPTEDYLTVTGPCGFEFPADHGAHPGYRTEWWYYTGNVADHAGNRFGFQLTFFRSQILTQKQTKDLPASSSAWRASQLYFAHAGVSDIGGKQFLHDDLMAREAIGMAGVEAKNETVDIWIKDWSAKIGPDSHELKNHSKDFSIAFTLTPKKAITAHGEDGYSRKGRSPERASCYYSFSRLQAEGTIQIGKQKYPVTGNAWMDHEYSSAPLEPVAVGWDWFSLQFDDQSELMLFFIREENGRVSPASGGTYVDPSGNIRRLEKQQIRIEVLNTWKSRKSGAVYPSQWEIQIPGLAFQATIQSNLADQELNTRQSTGVVYWEGSVSVNGEKNTKVIQGEGYAELTGYAAPFRSPL